MKLVTHPIWLCPLLLFLFFAANAAAGQLTAAVASNFTGPMEKITLAFYKKTGVSVKPVYASTGKLYAMIENGGPFDIFLAADNVRPALLHKNDMAGEPFVYANGKTVLWSNIERVCQAKDWQDALIRHSPQKIVIANPKLAPYGAAAFEAIEKTGDQGLINRLVFSQNISQAFAFAHKVTGVGFIADSTAHTKEGRQGCSWPVKEAASVEQSGCVLNSSTQREDAEKLASFILSPEVKTILTNSGYGI